MRTRRARQLGTPLGVETRKRILRLVERIGEAEASRVLRVSLPTMARAAAGFTIWEATGRLIETNLTSGGA